MSHIPPPHLAIAQAGDVTLICLLTMVGCTLLSCSFPVSAPCQRYFLTFRHKCVPQALRPVHTDSACGKGMRTEVTSCVNAIAVPVLCMHSCSSEVLQFGGAIPPPPQGGDHQGAGGGSRHWGGGLQWGGVFWGAVWRVLESSAEGIGGQCGWY